MEMKDIEIQARMLYQLWVTGAPNVSELLPPHMTYESLSADQVIRWRALATAVMRETGAAVVRMERELLDVRMLVALPAMSTSANSGTADMVRAACKRFALRHAEDGVTIRELGDGTYRIQQQLESSNALLREQTAQTLEWRNKHAVACDTISAFQRNRDVQRELTAVALATSPVDLTPIPMQLWCPLCHTRHIDEGKFASKPHASHACQNPRCCLVWKPAKVPTVGVWDLPGYLNEKP